MLRDIIVHKLILMSTHKLKKTKQKEYPNILHNHFCFDRSFKNNKKKNIKIGRDYSRVSLK